MAKTMKGIMLSMFIKTLEDKYGPDGMKRFEAAYGDINFSSFKDYPIEEEARLYDVAVKVFYPDDQKAGFVEFGKVSFNMYADSFMGRTFFALFNMDLKKTALQAGHVLTNLTKDLHLEVEDTGGKSFKIIVRELPYPPYYYEGVWLAALEHFKLKGTVKTIIVSDSHYEYLINWE